MRFSFDRGHFAAGLELPFGPSDRAAKVRFWSPQKRAWLQMHTEELLRYAFATMSGVSGVNCKPITLSFALNLLL
jgi:hypothetical protein